MNKILAIGYTFAILIMVGHCIGEEVPGTGSIPGAQSVPGVSTLTASQPSGSQPQGAGLCPIGGATAPELRNPHIASGALCRGACGSDCPSTCMRKPDITLCSQDPSGNTHSTCTYKNVIKCGSHLGCRVHDNCYDKCARGGETNLCNEFPPGTCHCSCDTDCISTYGVDTCSNWANGLGPFDSYLYFSDPPIHAGPFPGPCPNNLVTSCPEIGQTSCNGICTDTDLDSKNCGSCGNVCTGGKTCVRGNCVCSIFKTDCYGMCADTSSDPNNCGGCGITCTDGKTCSKGNCVCPSGQTDCEGTCKNTTSDNDNCGSCGHSCPSGFSCSYGGCCPAGEKYCDENCIDVLSDRNNCGDCGKTCPLGAFCSSGTCSCPDDESVCANRCVDKASDPQNCGECGKICTDVEKCVKGKCLPFDIEGSWNLLQPIQSDMQLTRSGNRVNGTYNSGEGVIGGTIDAQGIWSGTWSDSTGKGSFSVAFSDDAKTFYGNWKYSDSKGWDGVFEGKKTVAPNIA